MRARDAAWYATYSENNCLAVGVRSGLNRLKLIAVHSPADNADVSVPKTHGYAHPWDPPRFGTPAEVLRSLADDLVDKVLDKAFENADDEVERRHQQEWASDFDSLYDDLELHHSEGLEE